MKLYDWLGWNCCKNRWGIGPADPDQSRTRPSIVRIDERERSWNRGDTQIHTHTSGVPASDLEGKIDA